MRHQLSYAKTAAAASSFAFLVSACTPSGLSPQDKTVVISETTAFLDNWIETADKGEFEQLKPMYADQAGFRWIENGRVAYASAADAAAGLDMAATGGYTADMDISNREISPLAKDAAAVSADYKLTFQFGPDTRIETAGVFTAVLVKDADEWKFLQGHLSAPPADFEAPAEPETPATEPS